MKECIDPGYCYKRQYVGEKVVIDQIDISSKDPTKNKEANAG